MIGRCFVVAFAFLVASLVAAMVLEVGLLLPFWQGRFSADPSEPLTQIAVGVGFFFVSMQAVAPAIVIIVLAEAFRWRSVLFYGAAGGVLALALCYSIGFTFDAGRDVWPYIQAAVAAGIVAGLVYWLIAGRNAGRWCQRATPPAPQT
jgi:hypothetical protein